MVLEQKCLLTLENDHGLHLRAAAMFADIANRFKSKISVSNGQKTVNGKSMMHLMTLGTPRFGSIEVKATGQDSEEALVAIQDLLHDEAFINPALV